MLDLREMTGALFDDNGIVVVIKGVFHGPFKYSDKDKVLAAFVVTGEGEKTE